MRRFSLLLTATLISTLIASLIPQSTSANELAVWDRLQGTDQKDYVLLMRHALAPGVGDREVMGEVSRGNVPAPTPTSAANIQANQ